MVLVANLINGISLGCVYAIIAFGYIMIYDTRKVLNLAYGDVIMTGIFGIFLCMNCIGLPFEIGILVSIAFCIILGSIIERIAYRPFQNAASALGIMIITIGISVFLQNLFLLLSGGYAKSIRSFFHLRSFHLAGGKAVIASENIITILLGILVWQFLLLIIKRTKTGKKIQLLGDSGYENKEEPEMEPDEEAKIMRFVFILTSLLAAISGILLCSLHPAFTPYSGVMPGIKGFIAAFIGGMGSFSGAFLGGILIGCLEIIIKTYLTYQAADILIFLLLLLLLLLKPSGIGRRAKIERVS